MNKLTVLIVDDNDRFRGTLRERLSLRGFVVLDAASGPQALKVVRSHAVDVAVVDMRMPEMDGLVTITKIKEISPSTRTVLLTAHGDDKIRQASEALDSDFFDKGDMGNFWNFLDSVKGDQRVIVVAPPAAPPQQPPETPRRIIGQTEAMQQLKEDVERISELDCTVLILGETGTGKELVARSIHAKSPRGNGPFLAVNCGSFSHDLLSVELFGQELEEHGGVTHSRKGVFEAASGGALLLDEVADTPMSMQKQLLRILQDKKVIRVGGNAEIPIDVRILATSNQDLKAKMNNNEFREDVFFRLNVFTLHLPPLRERRDDIQPLCGYFLIKYNKIYNKNVSGFHPDTMAMLMSYPFPGNVRELENLVERAVIICSRGDIRPEHLPRRFQQNAPEIPVSDNGPLMTLAELERRYIKKVLAAKGGNKNEAAQTLGISRAGLWRKLKKMEQEEGLD